MFLFGIYAISRGGRRLAVASIVNGVLFHIITFGVGTQLGLRDDAQCGVVQFSDVAWCVHVVKGLMLFDTVSPWLEKLPLMRLSFCRKHGCLAHVARNLVLVAHWPEELMAVLSALGVRSVAVHLVPLPVCSGMLSKA